MFAAAVLIPLNAGDGVRVQILLISAVIFGAIATVCTGFLFTQRALRSLMGVPQRISSMLNGRQACGRGCS